MKRCPSCNRTYTDLNLSFCIDDGTPLVAVTSDEPTIVSSSPQDTGPSSQSPDSTRIASPAAPAYQPPGSVVPPAPASKRKIWPWVLGILFVLFLGVLALGIVAAIVIPSMMRAAANRNHNANIERSENSDSNLNSNKSDSNLNANESESDSNSNLNSNSPGQNSNLGSLDSENSNSNEEPGAAAPTDEQKVLADLTNIEHEWTAANINADKKALDRILADDYVGTSSDGKRQGKAQYIQTIERDTQIQKWDFEDLKVNLRGNRATLTGVIRLQLKDREVSYRFTDKFVWRDGRWQATASEVSPVK